MMFICPESHQRVSSGWLKTVTSGEVSVADSVVDAVAALCEGVCPLWVCAKAILDALDAKSSSTQRLSLCLRKMRTIESNLSHIQIGRCSPGAVSARRLKRTGRVKIAILNAFA